MMKNLDEKSCLRKASFQVSHSPPRFSTRIERIVLIFSKTGRDATHPRGQNVGKYLPTAQWHRRGRRWTRTRARSSTMDSNSLVNFNIQRASRFVTKNELAPPFQPFIGLGRWSFFVYLYFVLSLNLLGRRASLKN